MRHIVLLSLATLLAGCGLANFSPDQSYQVIVAAVEDCEVPPRGFSTPTTFMEVGFRQVRQACEAFFVNATVAQRNALAGSKGLEAGLLGTNAIVNAISHPADALKILTITTAGVVFVKELINQFTSIYTFGAHLYKVRQLVDGAMTEFAETARGLGPPENYCIAYNYVADFARLCSLASMQSLLDYQVAIPSGVVPAHVPVRRAEGGIPLSRAPHTARPLPRRPTTDFRVLPRL